MVFGVFVSVLEIQDDNLTLCDDKSISHPAFNILPFTTLLHIHCYVLLPQWKPTEQPYLLFSKLDPYHGPHHIPVSQDHPARGQDEWSKQPGIKGNEQVCLDEASEFALHLGCQCFLVLSGNMFS